MENLGDIRVILSDVIGQLRSKRKMTRDEIFRLRSIGYLSGLLVKLIEVSELEDRILRLEENEKNHMNSIGS